MASRKTSSGELQQPTLPLGRPNTSVAVLVEPKDVFVACGIRVEEMSVGGELKDLLIGRDPPMFILRDHDIIDSFVIHLAEVTNIVITLRPGRYSVLAVMVTDPGLAVATVGAFVR